MRRFFIFICVLASGIAAAQTPQTIGPTIVKGNLWAGPTTANLGAIVTRGDSQTAGNAGNTDLGDYPELMQPFVGPNVANQGIGGTTTLQTCILMGACPTTISVTGNAIAACAVLPCSGTTATFPTGSQPLIYSPITAVTTVNGVINSTPSIAVAVTVSSSGVYTVTPTAITAGASVPANTTFTVTNPYPSYLPIIWAGRNNVYTTTAASIQANYTSMLATLPTGQAAICPSILRNASACGSSVSGSGCTGTSTGAEWASTTNATTVATANAAIQTACGVGYIDLNASLAAAYNPALPTDVSDVAQGMVPTSLRAIDALGTLTSTITAGTTGSITTCNIALTLATPSLNPDNILTIDDGTSSAENVYVVTATLTTTITLASLPIAGDTITINGTVVTFVASGASGLQVNIGANTTITATSLYTLISGSSDSGLLNATYANPSAGLVTATPIPHVVLTLATSDPANITFSAPAPKVVTCIRGYGGVNGAHNSGAAVTITEYSHLRKEGYAVVAKALAAKVIALQPTLAVAESSQFPILAATAQSIAATAPFLPGYRTAANPDTLQCTDGIVSINAGTFTLPVQNVAVSQGGCWIAGRRYTLVNINPTVSTAIVVANPIYNSGTIPAALAPLGSIVITILPNGQWLLVSSNIPGILVSSINEGTVDKSAGTLYISSGPIDLPITGIPQGQNVTLYNENPTVDVALTLHGGSTYDMPSKICPGCAVQMQYGRHGEWVMLNNMGVSEIAGVTGYATGTNQTLTDSMDVVFNNNSGITIPATGLAIGRRVKVFNQSSSLTIPITGAMNNIPASMPPLSSMTLYYGHTGQWFALDTMGFPATINGVACTPGSSCTVPVSLSGVTGSIGGSALTAGQCASGTASVTSATAGMTGIAAASDGTYQAGFTVQALGTSSGTATVYVCAIVAGTPTAKTYNVRLMQ